MWLQGALARPVLRDASRPALLPAREVELVRAEIQGLRRHRPLLPAGLSSCPLGMRCITGWATEQLASKLDRLELAEGIHSDWSSGGWVSGEVTIGERKGKNYPVYSLEVELPWSAVDSAAVPAVACTGKMRLMDVSLEMLDDLDVEVETTSGHLTPELHASLAAAGVDVVQRAVREWASTIRKAVA